MVNQSISESGYDSPLTSYEKWLKVEGIDVIDDYQVDDVMKLPLKWWERKGGYGTHINLKGCEQVDDAYVCEIRPGKSLKPQKHLFEESILILQGKGATTIWNEGGPQQTFEWDEGSLFSPPLNAWHQHFNGQGDQPVKYLAVTNAPKIINIFYNLDFIFNNDFVFKDRYAGEEDFFSTKGKMYLKKIWDSNLIPDVRKFELREKSQKGKGFSAIRFELSNNTMGIHIGQLPVGVYLKAHRHGPGANLFILNGKGYTLMWLEGREKMKLDWQEGTLVVPPNQWFHQHFNTGSAPARYMAFHQTRSQKHKSEPEEIGKLELSHTSLKLGGHQIEYEDEDPEIREMFDEELKKSGIRSEMIDVPRSKK